MKTQKIDWDLIHSIILGAHCLLNEMIVHANARKNFQKGDPKVGGHSSASASCVHILGALHLIVRRGFDYMAHKPHASPTDHSFHYLLNLFFDKNGHPLSEEQSQKAMQNLRAFSDSDNPHVFQSYHSYHDPDHLNFLPSGTVGIPPVVLGYLSLAYTYARNQGYDVPPAHFWALIGDSELREGSLFEAATDLAERQVQNLTWIVDYNRQSLDGHRYTLESFGTDAQRIENTFLANGWDVVQVLHGEKRLQLFKKPQGKLFQKFLEKELSDWDLQILLQIQTASQVREFILNKSPSSKTFLKGLSDEVLVSAVHDLGGHDIQKISQVLIQSRKSSRPCLVIAHTLKGWGLQMAGLGGNHSSLPTPKEIHELKKKTKLLEPSFSKFSQNSLETEFLKQRSQNLIEDIQEQSKLKNKNHKKWKKILKELPQEQGISLKLMSYPHTQWMLGQWMSRMSRIASSSYEELKEEEKPFYHFSKLFVSLSPDVGTSTNLSFIMDEKIYHPLQDFEKQKKWGTLDRKSPNIRPHENLESRFLRFEIAEATALSCLLAFGKLKDILGIPIFPLMTVYDFFIKRALDQYFYGLYWGSHFVLAGTPSGVTLSPEGAQHGWKSDFQIPNQICWEPYFCVEVDWILTDALYRYVTGEDSERSGVLLRAVTKGVNQKDFLNCLKSQKKFKKNLESKKLHPKDFPIDQAEDESKVEPLADGDILQEIRKQVLDGAYMWIDYSGYADYHPLENVVNIFAMGALGTEARKASLELLKKGLYANVIIVTSCDLLLGSLAHKNNYIHLKQGLDLNLQVPVVSVHDGEPGLLDNIGSILGVHQEALAVRNHSLSGRPLDIYKYHQIDFQSVVQACLKILK